MALTMEEILAGQREDATTAQPVQQPVQVAAPAQPTSTLTTESEGTFQEIGEGILSGVTKAAEGVASTVAIGVDLMADTDYTTGVQESFEDLREYAGLDPVGFGGKAAEIITQYIVPGGLAMKGVTKLTKLGRQAERFRKGEAGVDPLNPGEKFALGAYTVGAAAGADIMVATDDATTIADFFEGGPTQTDTALGLSGREEAIRRLGNKIKIGTETGVLTATLPTALGATFTAAAKAGDVAATGLAPVLSPIARAVRESRPAQSVGDYLQNLEQRRILEDPNAPLRFGEQTLSDFLSVLRFRGYLPQELANERLLIAGRGESAIKRAQGTLNNMRKILDDTVDEYSKASGQSSELLQRQFFNTIENVLTSRTSETLQSNLDELPQALQAPVREMRRQVDNLAADVLNSDYIQNLQRQGVITDEDSAEALINTIKSNLNGYIRRRYKVFENASYKPSDEAMREAIDGFKNDPLATRQILEKLNKTYKGPDGSIQNPQYSAANLGLARNADELAEGEANFLVNNTVSQTQAETAARNFLQMHRIKNQTALKGRKEIARDRLNPALFLRKFGDLKDYQRKLLGEILDIDEAFLGTVADMSEFRAIDQFYGRIRELSRTNAGVRKLFVDTRLKVPDGASPEQIQQLAKARADQNKELVNTLGYRVLDGEIDTQGRLTSSVGPVVSSYGSLQGFAVPQPVYDMLSRTLVGQTNPLEDIGRLLWTGSVQAKSRVQYAKTVLSPITQIRNVTSASMFALMQGNIGRGANLGESFGLVLNDLKGLRNNELIAELEELQKLGVVGTQAELRELQDLIRAGAGVSGKETSADKLIELTGLPVGAKYGNRIKDTKPGKLLYGGINFAERAYQGGDDVWKIYNYKFELQKLRNATRGMSADDVYELFKGSRPAVAGRQNMNQLLKEEAADIVRNTVPNYNATPAAVQALRKIPIMGNFVSFPAEIIRTGANTIGRGFKELASTNKEMQKIGLRRLSGALFTTATMPIALQNIASSLTGVSKEELDAYQRTMAPPWEKNARLIPTGRDEKGLPTFLNFSYTNPYELFESTIVAGLNAFSEAEARGQDPAAAAIGTFGASLGEFFEPFVGESILAGRLIDVAPLGSPGGGRGGQTQTGARIYSDEDSPGDKMSKSFLHIVDAFLPNALPFTTASGDPRLGRFAQAWINQTGIAEELGLSTKDKAGFERQIAGELVRAVTGLTESTINLERGMAFKGLEYRRDLREVASIFNQPMSRPDVGNESQVMDAFLKANEAKYRVDTRFRLVMEDLERLGVPKSKIRRELSKIVGKQNLERILRNRFDPFEISETTERNMRKNDTWRFVPRSEIRAITREDRRRKLKQEEAQQSREPEQREPVSQGTQSAAPVPAPRPTTNVVPSTPIPVPNVQPPAQIGSQVSPILVPDPVTRATFGIE